MHTTSPCLRLVDLLKKFWAEYDMTWWINQSSELFFFTGEYEIALSFLLVGGRSTPSDITVWVLVEIIELQNGKDAQFCGLWVLHVDLSPWPLADAGTGSTSPRKSPEGYRVQEGDLVVKVNGVAATWRYYFGLFPPKKQALLWRFRHSKHPADRQLRGLTL